MECLSRQISFPKSIKVSKKFEGLELYGPLGMNVIPLKFFDAKGLCYFKLDESKNIITIGILNPRKFSKSLLNTLENIIKIQIQGVTQGFSMGLEVIGVGYRFRYEKESHRLAMKLGYSDESVFDLPQSILVFQKSPTLIRLYSVDKELITQVTAKIKQYFPPDPYKGKGIRYEGETLILKPGKKK